MSLWSGISPCMNLGVDGCVVWWEAWAAIAAGGAALVTGVLGYVTYRLAVATTEATKTSVKLAAAVKLSDEQHKVREAQLLGRLIFPEVVQSAQHYKKLFEELGAPGALDDVYNVAGGKDLLVRLAGGPGQPRCNEDVGRLAVFSARICDALGQGLGYVSTAKEVAKHFERKSSRENDEAMLKEVTIQVRGAARCFEVAKEELKNLLHVDPESWK